MGQAVLPIFAAGATTINSLVGFQENEGWIYYFQGTLPIYSHAKDDLNSFRFITAQLVVNGSVTQSEIVRAFGVTPISLKRSVKLLREKGIKGFNKIAKGGAPSVLTPEVLKKVQEKLDQGINPSQIAKEMKIHPSTIRKAIGFGRLKKNTNCD